MPGAVGWAAWGAHGVVRVWRDQSQAPGIWLREDASLPLCVRVGVLDRAPPADVPSAQRRPHSTSPRHCSRQAGHSLWGVPGTVTGRAASLTHPFNARSTPECPQMSPDVAQCLLEAESVLGDLLG